MSQIDAPPRAGHRFAELPDTSDPAAALTDPRIALTLDELSSCQGLAGKHITFSLTLACPLKCRHCIVDAGPEKGHTTMPLAVAERYAGQMADLAAYGIEGICFTGGEPTLARRQMQVMSAAAEAAGLETAMVTAAQWAATPKLAARTVADFPAIACWDVSFDLFHLDWVGFEHIRNAHDAILAAGRRFTLRFTYNDPPSETERALMARLGELEGAKIAAQRVRAVGRGEDMGIAASDKYNPWVKPCLTQGMVVRYDGSISPCCLNLVESRRHPFQLGEATARELAEIHHDYMRQPLLQLIRALGFGQLYLWLEEAGLTERLPEQLPDEACELCTLILQDRELADFLKAKAEEPANRLRIAVIAARSLGEDQMLRSLLEDDAVVLDPQERRALTQFLNRGRPDGATAGPTRGE